MHHSLELVNFTILNCRNAQPCILPSKWQPPVTRPTPPSHTSSPQPPAPIPRPLPPLRPPSANSRISENFVPSQEHQKHEQLFHVKHFDGALAARFEAWCGRSSEVTRASRRGIRESSAEGARGLRRGCGRFAATGCARLAAAHSGISEVDIAEFGDTLSKSICESFSNSGKRDDT